MPLISGLLCQQKRQQRRLALSRLSYTLSVLRMSLMGSEVAAQR